MNRYDLSDWKDAPDDSTPVTADRLNAMNNGIKNNNAEIIAIERGTKVVDKAVRIAKSDGTTYSVGGSTTPVYFNANGLPTACTPANAITKDGQGIVSSEAVYNALTGGMVTKLGTDNVGTDKRLFYLAAGTPTVSKANVGDEKTPVYMKNGTFTACKPDTLSVKVVTETVTGKITLPGVEGKTSTICTSTTKYDKTKSFVVGMAGIKFADNHHEWYCSDYDLSIADDGTIKAEITVPTHAELRGKSTNITVKVTVITL